VVKPGETLSRIVRSHYGTADPALVKAVYEANRKQMKSPNALAAGMKLVLPTRARPKGDASADMTLVAQAAPAETAAKDHGPKEKTPAETQPVLAAANTGGKAAKERWYVVQPGDLLSTVA
jgi:nucleoid-associated protein YgaU